tara:strand:- start:776 stop:1993 length:1218 start_codon:yes stop_codon:yes gene_type:complete
MKILDSNKILAQSLSSGVQFSADYPVDNIADDNPRKCFMANSASATISLTLESGMSAIFISGVMADSLTLNISDTDNSLSITDVLDINVYSTNKWLNKNNDAKQKPNLQPYTRGTFSGTVLSSPITTDTTLSDYLMGAPDTLVLEANLTLGNGGADLVILVLGLSDSDNTIENDWDGSSLGAGTATLSLESSTDLKGSPVEGNSIHQWDQSSGATGRFEDSSGDAINIFDHSNMHVGSIITIGGSDYQVNQIVGDGTGVADITLSGSVADATITSVKNPVRIGIFQASSVIEIENPQLGISKALQDFSIRKPLNNGGYQETQKNVINIFTCNLIVPIAQANNILDFYHAYRSKPFPVQVLNDLASDQSEAFNFSGFFYMIDAPEMVSADFSGSYQNLTFNIREVV